MAFPDFRRETCTPGLCFPARLRGRHEGNGEAFFPPWMPTHLCDAGYRAHSKLKAVSEYLGHASASITLDMYIHENLADEELEGLAQ